MNYKKILKIIGANIMIIKIKNGNETYSINTEYYIGHEKIDYRSCEDAKGDLVTYNIYIKDVHNIYIKIEDSNDKQELINEIDSILDNIGDNKRDQLTNEEQYLLDFIIKKDTIKVYSKIMVYPGDGNTVLTINLSKDFKAIAGNSIKLSYDQQQEYIKKLNETIEKIIST